MKHLCLEQREIDIRRAFRRAAFAGKTIAQRGMELFGFQRIVAVHAQLKRGANDVGPAAGGHDFFAGGHKRRAHNARLFEATAAAVALLEIANKRAVLKRKREHRLEWKLEWTREVFAQVIIDLVTTVTGNFPRIKNVLWIEQVFDLSQYPKQLVAELVVHVFGARDADAVLGGERTFELPHQRGGLIGDLPEFVQIGRAVHVENWSHMKQSAGSVTVVTRFQPEWLHDRLQPAHVFG